MLAESEIRLGNELNLGDQNLLKFYNAGSRLIAGEKLTTRRSCIFQLFAGQSVIDDNVFFNNHYSISCLGRITIGNDTFFGEGVKMYDHNHKYEFRDGDLYPLPLEFKVGEIAIGRNCWSASNVIIGAGCLIHKSVPPTRSSCERKNLSSSRRKNK